MPKKQDDSVRYFLDRSHKRSDSDVLYKLELDKNTTTTVMYIRKPKHISMHEYEYALKDLLLGHDTELN